MKKLQGETFGIEATEAKRYLPSFSITADDLPAIKDWQVGKTYELLVKVRMKSVAEREEQGAKKTRADLEIQAVELKDKETYQDEYARKRSAANK